MDCVEYGIFVVEIGICGTVLLCTEYGIAAVVCGITVVVVVLGMEY